MITFFEDESIIRKEKRKRPTYQEATRCIRALIHHKEPALARIFARFWAGQRNAITYAEIRALIEQEAQVSGSAAIAIDSEFMRVWREEYAQFIAERLAPHWNQAITAAAEYIVERVPGFRFDVTAYDMRRWMERHSAELVVQLTDGQRDALNAVIRQAVLLPGAAADQLAYVIRPLVGLYPQQATANFNYFRRVRETLLENNPSMRLQTAEKRAAELAQRYAEKQHRYRAMNIARNELAVAYRAGERLTIEQAQAQGLIGRTRRRWLTADDERVCSICRAMDGAEADDGEMFVLPNGRTAYDTQGHITCRCACEFMEIEPPDRKTFIL